jgi:hypothetical protein
MFNRLDDSKNINHQNAIPHQESTIFKVRVLGTGNQEEDGKMSLFQCENCGCVENTALASMTSHVWPEGYDWTGIEKRRGKHLCSACIPALYHDDTFGKWHDKFQRSFLPKAEWGTDRHGDLVHQRTGAKNFRDFAIKEVKL